MVPDYTVDRYTVNGYIEPPSSLRSINPQFSLAQNWIREPGFDIRQAANAVGLKKLSGRPGALTVVPIYPERISSTGKFRNRLRSP